MTTVAMAGVWEIVEWLYAAIDGGEAGAAFLGSQGDVWDAQKDILCDTLGALCAAVSYSAGRLRLCGGRPFWYTLRCKNKCNNMH